MLLPLSLLSLMASSVVCVHSVLDGLPAQSFPNCTASGIDHRASEPQGLRNNAPAVAKAAHIVPGFHDLLTTVR
jgi:hypothetical protein